jgi:hypothetical protein
MSYQLFRQNLVTSNMYRVYRTTDEISTLNILCCENKNFHEHRKEVINDLQLEILILTNRDLIPLYLLKWLFHEDELPIEELLIEVYSVLCRLRRRNT